MRDLINLIEHNSEHMNVFYIDSKEDAKVVYEDGINSTVRTGQFGYGFYVHTHPGADEDEDQVVLEFHVKDGFRILDAGDSNDFQLWEKVAGPHMENRHMYRLMVKKGIDAIRDGDVICFYNPDALHLDRVYRGVIDDPIEETDTKELDEIALGGLQRCTAVTINALLKAFNLRPITLAEVPVDNPGVLRVLTAHGLAYAPFPDAVGRTLQQFIGIHPLYDWYLLTPGHAMALIRGELFDAENKGPDGRKLMAAFRITRR